MTIGTIFIETDLILAGITLMVMLFGLFGLIIPILPGLVIIWVAALGYGVFAGFETLGWIMFVIITVLMIIGELTEHVLMGTFAHKEGAPWWVVLIVLVVAIAGNLVVPILGGILAGLLALSGIEWLRSKDAKKALVSMRGLLVGFAWGFAARFATGLVMIGSWCVWAFAY
jgi:uncharacterized protein YqgC (DUF456 family)